VNDIRLRSVSELKVRILDDSSLFPLFGFDFASNLYISPFSLLVLLYSIILSLLSSLSCLVLYLLLSFVLNFSSFNSTFSAFRDNQCYTVSFSYYQHSLSPSFNAMSLYCSLSLVVYILCISFSSAKSFRYLSIPLRIGRINS